MKTITKSIQTKAHTAFYDITEEIESAVRAAGVTDGLVTVYVPHTTAALTINENADPDVKTDLIDQLERMVPWENGYRHLEGNAAAHLKASMMGFSETIIIEDGRLLLGTWQGVYFTEFDGPRHRRYLIKILADSGKQA